MLKINTYSDGGCRATKLAGVLVPGGFGVVIELDDAPVALISGSSKGTSNNKMEVLGAMISQTIAQYIYGILESPSEKVLVTTTSDSQYAIYGATKWLPSWKKKNWKTASGAPVKNLEYWKVFDRIVSSHLAIKNMKTTFNWVKGHNGHVQNEICDMLADSYLTHDENRVDMQPDVIQSLEQTIFRKYPQYTDTPVIYVNLDKYMNSDDSQFHIAYNDICDVIAKYLEE